MNTTKILIIEDNPVSRKVLRVTLAREGYNVTETVDGTTGLEEAKKQNFDLIIQDLCLSDMNGFALNQKLRAIPAVKEIPIFALSGFLNHPADDSDRSGFTTFLFKPIEPSHLIEIVKAHLPSTSSSPVSIGKRKHILIADDNIVQLKLLAIQLTQLGFEVTCAQDGAIALQEALKRRPDVIISDVLMPNMDGFGLCIEIKRNPVLCDVPVLLLSSHYLEAEDLAFAKNVGASCYITRIPDVGKLITKLNKILNIKPSDTVDTLIELTDDIKQNRIHRSIRQLEQQVLGNAQLAQRCAMLMSQLSLIDGIASAITSSSNDIEESLKEIFYFCLDATGISKGALYLKKGNQMELTQYVGYAEEHIEEIKSLFGLSDLTTDIIITKKPLAISAEDSPNEKSKTFLQKANVASALIVPLSSGSECLGILFFGSDLTKLSDQHTKEFARTLGMQFGQSIALASTFDKLGSSEKRFRQLVEISPDAILIQQQEKFVYGNPAALKLLEAKNIDDLLARSCYEFIPSDYQNVIKDYVEMSTTQSASSHIEGKINNVKGEILDVEMVLSPFSYQDSPAVYMIMRDITERKRSALHLKIQYEIAWILAESATLYVATAKILKLICERLEWDCGAIWSVDKKANALLCTRIWEAPQIQNDAFQTESHTLSLAPGVGLPGLVWSEREVIWKSDILHDDTFLRKGAIAENGLNTAVAFPIIYENEVLGVIEFYSKQIRHPIHDLSLWFQSVGNQFGLFLVRKHLETQMLYLAEHDVLTGLSNRNMLEQYLTTALIIAKETNQELAILFLDLDHFKSINDSMGHEAGDFLLREISERFCQCIRPQDTISRLGGDEFVILIPNAGRQEIIAVINRLQSQLIKKIIINEKEFNMQASIGISIYPENGEDVVTLMKCADIAMYVAKEKGRNNFQFCTHDMTSKAGNRIILQNDLRNALKHNEFILYYQPKIDMVTQEISGMEALVRWKTPTGIICPDNFISTAEACDLIIPLGEWVIKAALAQHRKWQTTYQSSVIMSVNLSIRNLNSGLLQVIEKTLVNNSLNPCSFEVELTESALMVNVENNVQILRDLKAMGLKISIDDFGTGYSSLSYIKRFPIDTIKIDKSFVRDIATDPDDAAIVTAIIAMAHSLNFTVIAEGVETMEQLKFLYDHGCDEIQGFYYSHPLPAEDASRFIQNTPRWPKFSPKLRTGRVIESGDFLR